MTSVAKKYIPRPYPPEAKTTGTSKPMLFGERGSYGKRLAHMYRSGGSQALKPHGK